MAASRVEVLVAPPYPVVAGPAVDLGEAISGVLEPGLGVILADANVGPLHGPSVRRALEGAGWRIADLIEVPAG